MNAPGEFARIVLGLAPGAPQREPIELAADIARLLGARIDAFLARDRDAERFFDYPFAREFQPLLQSWRRLGPAISRHDLDDFSRRIERMVETACAANGVYVGFPSRQQEHDAQDFEPPEGDIFAVIEPESYGELALGRAPSALERALRSAATTLIVPRAWTRRSGPIAAILGEDEARGLALAARLAAATGADLVIARVGRISDVHSVSAAAGLPSSRIRLLPPAGHGAAPLQALRDIQERVLVVSKDAARISPLEIVAARRTPLFVVK